MQFPKSLHADMSSMSRDADSVSPSLHSRQFHALAIVVMVGALGAGAGLNLIDDPRPLDVQMSTALHNASDTLQDWQGQLSRGLQVSMRAVADGREVPDAVVAQAEPAPQPAVALPDNKPVDAE